MNKKQDMEKFNELRKEWIALLKTLKSMSTQTLYLLLEPNNDNKFFESVDSFKDCIEESQFIDFQILAIEYLLEYKKQNNLKIKIEPHVPNPGTWPFGSLDNGQLQKLTNPITPSVVTPNSDVTWQFKTIDPITPYYSTTPDIGITHTSDNSCSTTTKQDEH